MMGFDFEYMGSTSYDPMDMKYPSAYIIIDNEAARAMSECNKDTAGNRHIARRYHYVRQGSLLKEHEFHWIGTKYQLADPLTKVGSKSKFRDLLDKFIVDMDEINND